MPTRRLHLSEVNLIFVFVSIGPTRKVEGIVMHVKVAGEFMSCLAPAPFPRSVKELVLSVLKSCLAMMMMMRMKMRTVDIVWGGCRDGQGHAWFHVIHAARGLVWAMVIKVLFFFHIVILWNMWFPAVHVPFPISCNWFLWLRHYYRWTVLILTPLFPNFLSSCRQSGLIGHSGKSYTNLY